jgi:HCOMODA/2-hydroxy-3-carboxy-muconic semialdehyde decarboxylase
MSLIEDLVASYRILAEHEVIDGYGHVSVRSADNPRRYFISRSLAPELVTEKDIVELDLDSNPVGGDTRLLYLERFIHGEIYKVRPDVHAVVHNHSPSVIPFGITTVPLKPIFHMAAFVGLGIPNFEIRKVEKGSDLLVRTPKLGKALAKTLAAKPAALMRGHGSVVVGEDLQRAVGRSIYLEMSAKLQMQAMTIAGLRGRIATFDAGEVKASVPRQDYARAWNLWRTRALERIRREG